MLEWQIWYQIFQNYTDNDNKMFFYLRVDRYPKIKNCLFQPWTRGARKCTVWRRCYRSLAIRWHTFVSGRRRRPYIFISRCPCREDANTRYGTRARSLARAPARPPRPRRSHPREPRRAGHHSTGVTKVTECGNRAARWRGWRHHVTSAVAAWKRLAPKEPS